MEVLWRPAIEKRMDEFLNLLVAELDRHDGRIEDLERLVQRDLAISAGVAGVRAAARTSDEDKLRYLAAAVARVTVDPVWDARADFALLLLQIAADLTATHVRVLSRFASPEWPGTLKAVQDHEITMDVALRRGFPDDDFVSVQAMISDLASRNLLVNRSTFFGLSTLHPEKVSDLGLTFLDFIAHSDS